MNQFFHLPNLKTVYHDVHHCLRGIRIISLRLGDRHPTLKGFGECRADLIRMHRDDCSGFGSIQTFHNKVHCLQRCPVGYDRVQWKDPAVNHKSADNIQYQIICHHKRTHRDSQPFCKDDGENFDAVHRSSKPNRHTTSDTGDQPAKNSAEKQIRSGKWRYDTYIHRQYICDQPCPERIDHHRVNRIDGKYHTLFSESV